MEKIPKNIETDRLRLRLPRLDDAEAIFLKYAQDLEVTKYLIWAPHSSIAQTKEFIQSCVQRVADGDTFPRVIEIKSNHELIGMIDLRIVKHRADFGYVVAQDYWGEGYATEALKAVVSYALSLESIFRVWAVCDVENIASARVMEKAGLEKEGVLRNYIIHPGISHEPRDCFCYSIVK